jgi:hypothetical protein
VLKALDTGCWRGIRGYLQRWERGTVGLDEWLLLGGLRAATGALLAELKEQQGLELLSRAARVLTSQAVTLPLCREGLRPTAPGGLLVWSLMEMVAAGTQQASAVGIGSLPGLKVIIARWLVASSVTE